MGRTSRLARSTGILALALAVGLGAPRALWASDGAWSEIPPPGRQSHSAIYDAVRQRLIVAGGRWAENPAGVWVLPLDASMAWTFLPTSGRDFVPNPGGAGTSGWSIADCAAIYDPVRDRMLIEGADNSGLGGDAVYVLSFSSMAWSKLATAGTPPPGRFGHSAVYDPVGDRMITYGGATDYYSPAGKIDVWVLSLSGTPTWTLAHPAGTAPPGRIYHGAIHDAARGRMVIFGGTSDFYSDLNDVWALSLSGAMSWTQLQPSGTPPAPTYQMGIAYDPGRDRMLLVGGTGSVSPFGIGGQTWSLDFSTMQWQELLTTGAGGPIAVYDPLYDRVITYNGGSVRELRFSPTPSWRRVGPFSNFGPGPYYDTALCFDSPRARAVGCYGGAYDTDYAPAAFDNFVYAYGLSDSIWRHVDSSIPYASRPSARIDHSAIVDPVRGKMIVFGGYADFGGLRNDLWSFQLAPPVTWTQLTSAGTPPSGRGGHAAIYDPSGDRMLLFGGADNTSSMNDLWALPLGAPMWLPLTPAGTPPSPRQNAAAVYDPTGNRMLLFGGFPGRLGTGRFGAAYNDLWALALSGGPAWTQLSPTGTPPPPTHDPIAIYDPDRNRVEVLTDAGVWALKLGNPPSWQRLDIENTVYGRIERGAATYDPVNHRVLLVPGESTAMWELRFPDLSTAVAISLIRASAKADRARLEWQIETGAHATVQRTVPNGTWTERASLTADANGRVTFEDADVVAGARYGYRLVAADGAGSRTGGEAWVTIPACELALRGAMPNPVTGPVTIAFTLPGDAQARLALYDIAGREIAAREVGGLGPGPHAVDLAPGASLAPGVYVVRLSAGGRALTSRVAVVR